MLYGNACDVGMEIARVAVILQCYLQGVWHVSNVLEDPPEQLMWKVIPTRGPVLRSLRLALGGMTLGGEASLCLPTPGEVNPQARMRCSFQIRADNA